MQFSWRTILSPWIGALAGWLAGHGFALTHSQILTLTALSAAAAANAQHVIEQWLSPPPVAGPPVRTIVKPNDPAKKLGSGPPPAAAVLLLLVVSPLVLSLQSCSALGLHKAQSTDESIAYGYGLYTAVEEALSASVAAGQISKSTAVQADEKAAAARQLLDAAKAAETVNPSAAATDLATATQVLTALQAWLNHLAGALP